MVEQTKGNLLVAATVIAALSFKIMINPPGGVSQIGDTQSPKATTGIHKTFMYLNNPCEQYWGTSVIGCGTNVPYTYGWMVINSNVAFAASMGVVLLAVSGLRLRYWCSLTLA